MAAGTLQQALSIQLFSVKNITCRTAQNIYFLEKGYILPQKAL